MEVRTYTNEERAPQRVSARGEQKPGEATSQPLSDSAEVELDRLYEAEATVISQDRSAIPGLNGEQPQIDIPSRDPNVSQVMAGGSLNDEPRVLDKSLSVKGDSEDDRLDFNLLTDVNAEKKAEEGTRHLKRSIAYTNFVECRLAAVE